MRGSGDGNLRIVKDCNAGCRYLRTFGKFAQPVEFPASRAVEAPDHEAGVLSRKLARCLAKVEWHVSSALPEPESMILAQPADELRRPTLVAGASNHSIHLDSPTFPVFVQITVATAGASS